MAVERRLAESSQNQALCALVFLYEHVLIDELGPQHLGHVMNRPAVSVTSPLDRLAVAVE